MNTDNDDQQSRYASDVDVFSRDSLINPYDNYRALRDTGPLAFMAKYDTWIATRYEAVKRVLCEPETFSSAQGIGFNDILNEAWAGMLPTLDPPEHTRLRKIYNDVLKPQDIEQYRAGIEAKAEAIVDQVIDMGEFDGITEFADTYPVAVMADLIGFPDDERRNQLVHWATDSYNCCGPLGTFDDSLPAMQKLYDYVSEIVEADNIRPESFAGHVMSAMKSGEITKEEAIGGVGGDATAGLDTTANAVAAMLLMFSRYPDQYALVRNDPKLAVSAMREVLRLETPAAWFTRVTTCDVEFDDISIPANTRMIHNYAAANRDERQFRNADEFDVRRAAGPALTWGFGIHTCPGQFISMMETTSLLKIIARRIDRMELTGEPVRRVHNLTRGLEALPMKVYAK